MAHEPHATAERNGGERTWERPVGDDRLVGGASCEGCGCGAQKGRRPEEAEGALTDPGNGPWPTKEPAIGQTLDDNFC